MAEFACIDAMFCRDLVCVLVGDLAIPTSLHLIFLLLHTPSFSLRSVSDLAATNPQNILSASVLSADYS